MGTNQGNYLMTRIEQYQEDTLIFAENYSVDMKTIILLTISNIFMTFAWYGHLKFENAPMWKVILIAWGIAFLEYCFMIPANRIGYTQFNAFQLKTIQEVITLVVFTVFAIWFLKEPFRWNYLVGFVLLVAAVYVIFKK
jgi:uncharacterized protein (DUF486 family)